MKVRSAWLTCAYLDCVKICMKGGAFSSLLNVYVCKSTGIVKSRKPLLQYNTRKHVMSLDTYQHNIPETKPEPLQFSIPVVFPFAYLPITWNEETGSPWLIRYQELLSSLWKRDTPMQDRETSYLSVFQGGFLTSQNNILSENKKQEDTHTHTQKLHYTVCCMLLNFTHQT